MDTTAIIRTLALHTGITGLTGLLAAYLSALAPGITDTMGRAVSTAVRVMATGTGLDMDIGQVMGITRRSPARLWVADIPQRVSTPVLAAASMVVVTVAAVPIGNLLQGAAAKCCGTLNLYPASYVDQALEQRQSLAQLHQLSLDLSRNSYKFKTVHRSLLAPHNGFHALIGHGGQAHFFPNL